MTLKDNVNLRPKAFDKSWRLEKSMKIYPDVFEVSEGMGVGTNHRVSKLVIEWIIDRKIK